VPLRTFDRPGHRSCYPSPTTRCYGSNWLGDLWDEFIEFSTYGPGERKLLKARREEASAAAAAAKAKTETGNGANEEPFLSDDLFRQAKKRALESQLQALDEPTSVSLDEDSSSLSLEAFQAAAVSVSKTKEEQQQSPGLDFDGYKLRDLLVKKWGVPLDVEFQRGYSGRYIYCTILPVAFGNRKCRHKTELEYLEHLQGVVEALDKYDNNLGPFVAFLKRTKRSPKP